MKGESPEAMGIEDHGIHGTTFTTYRLADGSLIYGEFSFVTETEFFDDIDQPLSVIKETWLLKDRESIEFKPYWWDDEDPEGMNDTLTGGP